MTDPQASVQSGLFAASAAPARAVSPAPQRLTLAHQALVNLMAVAALSIHHDQAFADRMEALRQILPAARHDVPDAFRPLVEAAEELSAIWPAIRKGDGTRGAGWGSAMLTAQGALVRFFETRAFAALEAHHADFTPAAGGPDARA